MNLKREIFAAIKDFDEPREALARRHRPTHQFRTMMLHQVPKRGSGQRPFRHNRLPLGSIRNLPRFTNHHANWQGLSPLHFQLAPAPKTLLGQRAENQGSLQHQAATVLGSVK